MMGDDLLDDWDAFDYDERVVAKWPAVLQRAYYAGELRCGACGQPKVAHLIESRPADACATFVPTPPGGVHA